ncbi:MAG TPA: HEAT repeat domain-containing protein [Myxococcota bacterium]|nr:HEAT repeat domain-containing protein [Myxococcota bacterium]
MADDAHNDPKKLASELLQNVTPHSADAPPAAGTNAATGDDANATELVELYFQLEEPDERDAVFEQLAALDSPVVTEFFEAMMDRDEDEFMRNAAAVELARRGHGGALAVLEEELRNPTELLFFEQAVQVLVEVRGASMYEPLRALWESPDRDPAERRELMVGMELADPLRAMEDFAGFITRIEDPRNLPDDQLEVAMMAFGRQGYTQVRPALEALKSRILAASFTDPDEQTELAAFVQEGIDLLDD